MVLTVPRSRSSELGEAIEAVETIEQRQVDEPAQPQANDERLRIAKHIAQVMLAAGIDCEVVELVDLVWRLIPGFTLEVGQTWASA